MTTTPTEATPPHKDLIYSGPHETMGQYLQRARIEQDKTLESVAESTCIHIGTLQALEDDDYDKLPAEVFVRGFIKIYANHLHLDADKALSLFQPVPGPDPNDYAGRKGPKRRILPGETLAEASPFTTGRQILIAAVVLLFAYFAYTSLQSDTTPVTTPGDEQPVTTAPAAVEPPAEGENAINGATTLPPEGTVVVPAAPLPASGQTTPAATVGQPAAGAQAIGDATQPVPASRLIIVPNRRKITHAPQPPAPVAPMEPANANGQPAAVPPVSQAAPPANTGAAGVAPKPAAAQTTKKATAFSYVLKANFTDLTWLQVTLDDGPQRDYTFRSGEQWEWQANQEIKLHIGNAGGVHLTLNNRTLPPVGEAGQSVRITLPNKPR
ncbi:MAG: DUF4115 domain-containing protein [Desulfobulbaceae bacterium]|nr:DUF4115 domain-containing protein [Desulfobulbaceae bacterium]